MTCHVGPAVMPRPGQCSCGSPYGCYEDGPEPRERPVPCKRCSKQTWAVDAVCLACRQ